MTTQNSPSKSSPKRKISGLGFKEWMFLIGVVALFVVAAMIEPLSLYAFNQMIATK